MDHGCHLYLSIALVQCLHSIRTAVLGGIRWNPLSCPTREAFFAPSFYLSYLIIMFFIWLDPSLLIYSPVVLNSIHIADAAMLVV